MATALLGSLALRAITGSEIAAAYGGVVGESLGFYGTVMLRDLVRASRAPTSRDTSRGTWHRIRAVGRSLVLEFGPAELVDSTVIRPLAMRWATTLLGRAAGVPLGKVAADVVFYIITIGGSELRRHMALRTRG